MNSRTSVTAEKPTTAKTILKRAMVVAIVVIPISTVAVVAYPKVRLTGLHLIGRTGGCAYSEVLVAFEESTSKYEILQRTKAEVKHLETDGNLGLWDTPMGRFWSPLRTDPTLLSVEQEWGVYDRYDLGVQPGDVVLDCGANVGLFTRNALMKGASKIIAIEPVPENLECLRRNFPDEIASGQVVIVAKGVWDQEDELPMFEGSNSAIDSFAWRWHDEADARKLPVTTIDNIVREMGLDRVDFIELDIEGSEPQAVKGAANTLRTLGPRIVFDADNDVPSYLSTLVTDIEPSYESRVGPCIDIWSEAVSTAVYLSAFGH